MSRCLLVVLSVQEWLPVVPVVLVPISPGQSAVIAFSGSAEGKLMKVLVRCQKIKTMRESIFFMGDRSTVTKKRAGLKRPPSKPSTVKPNNDPKPSS